MFLSFTTTDANLYNKVGIKDAGSRFRIFLLPEPWSAADTGRSVRLGQSRPAPDDSERRAGFILRPLVNKLHRRDFSAALLLVADPQEASGALSA